MPNGDGKPSGTGFNLLYPFFVGFVDGAAGRPAYLANGALRTFTWLGVNGSQASNAVVFHNYLTQRALQNGYQYVRGHDVDPTALAQIWHALPPDAQNSTAEWSAKTAGGFVGGSIVGSAISKQLIKFLPKRFVFPSMLFLGCQGFLGSIWRDSWGGGPPPPPGGMGGGGIAT